MAHLVRLLDGSLNDSADGTSLSASFSGSVSNPESDDYVTNDAESDEALVPFDRGLAGLHAYLGDCEELSHSPVLLEDGHTCRLPVLQFSDVVVTPGCTLPLLVCNSRAHWVVEQALAAQPPYTRLIGVVFQERTHGRSSLQGRIGCTAHLRKLQREDNGIWPTTLKVLAEGSQRCEVLEQERLQCRELKWSVRIIADCETPRVPREVSREHSAYWCAWAWRSSDAWALSDTARRFFAEIAPEVRALQGDPVAVSYWLARNLPLSAAKRQRLLEEPSAAHRLRHIIALLRDGIGDRLLCRGCHHQVGRTQHTLRITEEGSGGIFVNNSGYVHDVVALSQVKQSAVALHGHPTEEHSWFPGYAWTLAVCSSCGSHLGWQFLSVRGQSPRVFYGIRRQSLTSSTPSLHRQV